MALVSYLLPLMFVSYLFTALYLVIGAIIAAGAMLRNRDMIDDMGAAELLAFLVFFVLTWPSHFIGGETE